VGRIVVNLSILGLLEVGIVEYGILAFLLSFDGLLVKDMAIAVVELGWTVLDAKTLEFLHEFFVVLGF
jgi:hypothetical protein